MHLRKISLILALFFLTSCFNKPERVSSEMRVGWQIPWATQGQLVQVFKHTNILKDNNIKAEFIGRTYGPMLNELALADELDVVLTADQPAAVLFSKDKGWIGIGRLMYNRTVTYVPLNSPIKTMSDLKGKKIGVPMGAAAERVAVEALLAAGLKKNDFELINLDIREHMPLILKHKEDAKWGELDALAGFDPVPAILEAKKLVRPIHVGKVVSLVLMNKGFIEKNPKAPFQFMKAMKQAYVEYQKNRPQANEWFMAEAKLSDASHDACNIAAMVEPNLVWGAPIKLGFDADDFKILQSAADFIEPKINKKVTMKDFVSNKYVEGI